MGLFWHGDELFSFVGIGERMARTGTDSGTQNPENTQEIVTFHADGQDRLELPSSDFITDAKMTREGDNLILQAPGGETVVIEGYFFSGPCTRPYLSGRRV